MAVAFEDQERDTSSHRQHREHVEETDGITHDDCRGERAYEGRCREVRSLARRTDETERVRIEHDADAITEEPKDQCCNHDPKRWQPSADYDETEDEIDGTGAERLDLHDGERIPE